MNDPVSHPAHYTKGNIEVIDFLLDQDFNFLAGTAVKYICRYRYKSHPIEDLQKAAWYLEKLINIELEKETMLVTLKPGTQPTSLETQGQHYHIGREG